MSVDEKMPVNGKCQLTGRVTTETSRTPAALTAAAASSAFRCPDNGPATYSTASPSSTLAISRAPNYSNTDTAVSGRTPSAGTILS